MPRRASLRRLLLLAPILACAPEAPGTPPDAEFVVAAGDSSFWVRAGEHGVAVRRAPLLLARVDGRFYELYVTDADRSFYDAVFVGQRLWRRDLRTNDSLVVFEDTVVPRLAREWGTRHPDARPLAPEEDESEHPAASVTADVEVVDVVGGYVTVESYADVHLEDGTARHEVRRGVVDLRSGRPVTLGALLGDSARARVLAAGRTALRAAMDSVRSRRDARARRAARALHGFAFDERSFAVTTLGREPGIAFLVPGRGEDADGLAMPLPPVAAPTLPGWAEARAELPEPSPEGRDTERWRRPGYELLARYAADEAHADLALRAEGREWAMGRVPAPVSRVYWLDHPPLDDQTREALAAAFAEAESYGRETWEVRRTAPPASTPAEPALLAAYRPTRTR